MRLQIKILAPLLWKIFAESRAGNICVLDCYTEILHAGREVVKLCSIFRVPESRAVMMSLKLLQCCWLIAYLYLQYDFCYEREEGDELEFSINTLEIT
jgi:hypothetical protein